MASTTFIDQQTVIQASWLNDINNHVYKDTPILPASTVHDSAKIKYTPLGTSSVDSTVKRKLDEQTSVVDFGADTTGASSSVAAFQTAINSRPNSGLHLIHVPSGTYLGDMSTLSYGSRTVVWMEEGNVSYPTAPPNGEFCVRKNATSPGDSRPWTYGLSGIQYAYTTGTNRPILRIQKTSDHSNTSGNASALSVQNIINHTSGAVGTGAAENALVLQTDIYRTDLTGDPTFGLLQGTQFKHSASSGNFIAANFVARDQTKLGATNSGGTQVGLEVDVVASGPDTTSRIIIDAIGRGYDSSLDGATSIYSGVRVRPAEAGVLSAEPVTIENAFVSDIGTLGAITTHYNALGACAVSGAHFEAFSDATIQGILKVGCQKSTNGNVISQVSFTGFNTSSVKTNYANIQASIGSSTAGSENGNLLLQTRQAGVSTTQITLSAGVQVGTPTGGAKGTGTINVAGDIYKNNTAYTNPDYVFEKEYTGSIVRFINNPGASSYTGRKSIKEIEEITKTTLRLPGFGDNPSGAFERFDMLLEKLEEAYLCIFELNSRLEKLEAK